MSEYQTIRGISLKKAVKAEFRGDAALAFKAIRKYMFNKSDDRETTELLMIFNTVN